MQGGLTLKDACFTPPAGLETSLSALWKNSTLSFGEQYVVDKGAFAGIVLIEMQSHDGSRFRVLESDEDSDNPEAAPAQKSNAEHEIDVVPPRREVNLQDPLLRGNAVIKELLQRMRHLVEIQHFRVACAEGAVQPF